MNDAARPKPTAGKTLLAARARLRTELDNAARRDAGLQRLLDTLGYPLPRQRAPGFATLLQIIVSQQLSTGVAAAIWGRLEKLCRGNVTHRKILNRAEAELQACGLSRQKVQYGRELAKMVAEKTIHLESMSPQTHTAEEVIDALVKIRGIGIWSAEIYAMFALDFTDVFPSGDLALQVAVQRYESLPERPDAKTTADLAQKWSPHRSSVALLMWCYYGAATLDSAARAKPKRAPAPTRKKVNG